MDPVLVRNKHYVESSITIETLAAESDSNEQRWQTTHFLAN